VLTSNINAKLSQNVKEKVYSRSCINYKFRKIFCVNGPIKMGLSLLASKLGYFWFKS